MSNKLTSKAKSQKKKRDDSGIEIAKSVIEYILAVVGIVLCSFIPLYLKNGYYGVGNVKYELYKGIMIVAMIALIFMSVVYWMVQSGFGKDTVGDTDRCMVIFMVLSFISAVVGGNFAACITGYNGWYMGVFSLLTFVLLYYYFSRFGRYYKIVLICLCVISVITYIIGILHRLMIDVIGTYEGIADKYKNQFLSTLGQATWYSSFLCTVLPLGIALFWCASKRNHRILGGVFSFLGFATLVTQGSDSAYVALAGFMLVFFWFSVTSIERIERFMEILLLFVAATRFMNLAFLVHPNPILELDTLSEFLVFHPLMWGALIVVGLLWGLSFLGCKKKIYSEKVGKICRNVVFALVGLGILMAVLILYLGAHGKLSGALEELASKIPYLTWSNDWGNGRGGTWAFSWRMFMDMDFGHKLFGVGPDGYAPYAYSFYQERLTQLWGDRTLTNAHNEWMNAVICYGLLGAAAYIGIFISAIKRFSKNWTDNPMMIGFIGCIISYMCHNFFCYQQVCCTPFIFIIIGCGIYIMREKGTNES